MTPKEFIFWLKGIDVLTNKPNKKTWKLIREKLSEVDMDDKEPYKRNYKPTYIPEDYPPIHPIKVPPHPGSPPEIVC